MTTETWTQKRTDYLVTTNTGNTHWESYFHPAEKHIKSPGFISLETNKKYNFQPTTPNLLPKHTTFYNPPVKPYIRPPETLKEEIKRNKIEEYMKKI